MIRHALPAALLLIVAAPAAHAGDLADQRALALAKDTLQTVQQAEAALEEAVLNKDDMLYRRAFERPLKRIPGRWEQAPHLTDIDLATHMDCRTAANDLLQYGQAVARGATDESWKQYSLRRYRESLEACKDSIRHPEQYRLR